jgi:hypothetical protein
MFKLIIFNYLASMKIMEMLMVLRWPQQTIFPVGFRWNFHKLWKPKVSFLRKFVLFTMFYIYFHLKMNSQKWCPLEISCNPIKFQSFQIFPNIFQNRRNLWTISSKWNSKKKKLPDLLGPQNNESIWHHHNKVQIKE